jgi:hypothetical protein
MAFTKPQPRKPKESVVDLAIAAIEGNPNPLDMDLTGIDPAPTSLDLPEQKPYGRDEQRNPRCASPAVDACAWCGQPICEDCL